jgi:hypothetical protein
MYNRKTESKSPVVLGRKENLDGYPKNVIKETSKF